MEKFAWKSVILPGKKEEYIKAIKNIWPEMIEVFKEASIKNYSIFINGNEVFGCYECERGIENAIRIQQLSSVIYKWNKYMEQFIETPIDPETLQQPVFEEIITIK